MRALAAKAQTVVETDEEQDWYRFGADDFDAVIRAHVKGILEAANVDGMCGCLLCCN